MNQLSGQMEILNPELASFFHFDDQIPRRVLPKISLISDAYLRR